MQGGLNRAMDNAYPISPEGTLGLSVICSVPTGRPVFFCFFFLRMWRKKWD